MKAVLYFITALLLFAGCTQKKGKSLAVYEAENLTIQVNRLDSENNGSIHLGVRILPAKLLMDSISEATRNKLWYQMDSSFYLQSDAKKYQNFMTEAIANGQKNSLEYLVIFEVPDNTSLEKMHLIFDDRYISHKTYQVALDSK